MDNASTLVASRTGSQALRGLMDQDRERRMLPKPKVRAPQAFLLAHRGFERASGPERGTESE